MTRLLASLITLCALLPALCLAQNDDTTPEARSPKPPVEIPDEPRIVDPIQFMPEALQKKVTVDLDDVPLNSFFDWLNENAGMPVIVNSAAVKASRTEPTHKLTLRATELPLYQVLNRVSTEFRSGLTFSVRDGILQIMDPEERTTVRSYNVSHLIDAGFGFETLVQIIQDFTEGPWFDVDGVGGSISVLGDVLFIKQHERVHLEIAALLQGLKEHGRETRLLVSAEQLALEDRLKADTIAFDFDEQRLDHTIQVLREQTGLEIVADWSEIKKSSGSSFDERAFVTLKVPESKLESALRTLLQPFPLVAVARDGYLEIQSQEDRKGLLSVAVYDVRDLCRDDEESMALIVALQDQVSETWFDIDGVGGELDATVYGTLIVRQTDQGLREVRTLLATYREALMASKPRELTKPVDLEEQVTRYYRLETSVAEDLEKLLPTLVSPESWKSEMNPHGGTILVVSGGMDVVDTAGAKIAASGQTDPNAPAKTAIVFEKSVLIIHQTRKVHAEIGKTISRIQSGDWVWKTEDEAKQSELGFPFGPHGYYGGGGIGGGGLGGGAPAPSAQQGGGGFGGGYF